MDTSLALKLNVDFSDANQLSGSASLRLGDLRLCGLILTPGYNGQTVRDFLGSANVALGGGPAPYLIDDIANLANDISLAFEGGSPSLFARRHVFNGACP